MEHAKLLIFLTSACLSLLGPNLGGYSDHAAVEVPEAEVVLERYLGGEFDAAVTQLRAGRSLADAAKSLMRGADRWIELGRDNRIRRSGAVAALALELVASARGDTFYDFRTNRTLLEWACQRWERQQPSEAERMFHLASIALYQGMRDDLILTNPHPERYRNWVGGTRGQHVRHAAARFPHEARFKLAWATAEPVSVFIASTPIAPGELNPGNRRFVADDPIAVIEAQNTRRALGLLVSDPAVGAEARLRRGVVAFIMDAPADARGDFEQAATSDDPFVNYLAHLMLGTIHERSGDSARALHHFLQAFETIPARAAALAYAAALVKTGRVDDGTELIERWLRSTPPPDPWRIYSLRDYRFFDAYRDRMRRLVSTP